MPASATLDTQLLADLKDLLADSFNELIDRYTEDTQARFNHLSEAICEGDHTKIYHESHGIKGSSANVGATQLARICGQIEAMGQANTLDGVNSLFAQAQQEFNGVSEYLLAQKV